MKMALILATLLAASVVAVFHSINLYLNSVKAEYSSEQVDKLMQRAERICGTPVEYFAIEKGDLRVGCKGEL